MILLDGPARRTLVALTVIVAVPVMSCGGDDTARCVSGEQVACACGGGEEGYQRCGADGAFGACVCGEGGSGGGAGGRGGAGGEAGAGGDAGGGGSPQGGSGPGGGGSGGGRAPCKPDIDLLLVVDNSNSMTEEQASFVAEVQRLVDVLATGDLDGDGVGDFPPAQSVHVGIVTTDMGVGGATVPTCTQADFGDDGILRTAGSTTDPRCDATYPAPLISESGASIADFAADVSCMASPGTGGCGFEQPLEGALKAISPSAATAWTASGYAPPTFHGGTFGHALAANAGMVRPDSVLAVVLLTDEEDCSASDPDLFNQQSTTYLGDLNLRCLTYPGAQHAPSRFVEGLAGLRRDPGHFVFSVIAGVPPDLSGTTAAEYDQILTDDRMQAVVDPANPTRPMASCDIPGLGVAFPPRRMVEVAKGLEAAGSRTSVGSICQADLTSPIDQLLANLADALATCEP